MNFKQSFQEFMRFVSSTFSDQNVKFSTCLVRKLIEFAVQSSCPEIFIHRENNFMIRSGGHFARYGGGERGGGKGLASVENNCFYSLFSSKKSLLYPKLGLNAPLAP